LLSRPEVEALIAATVAQAEHRCEEGKGKLIIRSSGKNRKPRRKVLK